ncbi:MAG: large subunit ribosomal protein L35Ae [archaeon GW2011_AR17]|nr:MAG: large subunit ribosomal protein L35Ae [archaeon GW2011_AR17]MBS3153794.1 50S ribosomal protein L35ae [Candidatus Woesearchaeota archaeon]HIJ04562.1 50S ribosomal protein L35ae [Nanoarchaeota archaeon]
MEGIINNFRRSKTNQNTKHLIISIDGIDSRIKAQKFLGKKVIFTTETGKEITGEVMSAHGNKGCIRAIFERALPGQSLGQKVKVA